MLTLPTFLGGGALVALTLIAMRKELQKEGHAGIFDALRSKIIAVFDKIDEAIS